MDYDLDYDESYKILVVIVAATGLADSHTSRSVGMRMGRFGALQNSGESPFPRGCQASNDQAPTLVFPTLREV